MKKVTLFLMFVFGLFIPFGSVFANDVLPPAEITSFNETHTDTSINMTWVNPTDTDFSYVNIYKNGVPVHQTANTTYTDIGLVPNTTYDYLIVTVDNDGNESVGTAKSISTNATLTDTLAPANVTNLSETHTDDSITLTWTNPSDVDLDKIKIYKDATLLSIQNVTTTYQITNLQPDTDYNFKVVSTDTSGNDSTGSLLTVRTNSVNDLVAPDTPTGVTVNEIPNGIVVNWDTNQEIDLRGYNIYLDGVKRNGDIVSSTSYTISGLANGQAYSIAVSSVDKSGNESTLTQSVSSVPQASNTPIFSMSYDIYDYVDGIEKWFSNVWLVLAFAISIPLSFYVAVRLKLMFIE